MRLPGMNYTLVIRMDIGSLLVLYVAEILYKSIVIIKYKLYPTLGNF